MLSPLKRTAFAALAALALGAPAQADTYPVRQIAYIKAEGEKWGTLVRRLGLQGSQ